MSPGPIPDDSSRGALPASVANAAPMLKIACSLASAVSASAEELIWLFRAEHKLLASDMETVLEEVRWCPSLLTLIYVCVRKGGLALGVLRSRCVCITSPRAPEDVIAGHAT